MIAVSDTGPLQYLSLIDQIGLLPQIFHKILVPRAVVDELSHPSTPPEVAALIARPPAWLEVCAAPALDAFSAGFGLGERQAFGLIGFFKADALLTNDARAKRFDTQALSVAASGTIGILYEAAENDLISFTARNFDGATEQLLATNFRSTPTLRKMIESLSLRLHKQERQSRPVP